jgi:3-oxoacyl-[acyl-carrier-protein] synthase I
MNKAQVSIAAAGMVTAIGFNASATCAALRAGIRNVCQTNLWDAETGSFLSAGRVALPQWWVGVGKMADLIAPAIQECLEAAPPRIAATNIPILLVVPSASRPHRFPQLETALANEIEYRLSIRLHPDSVVIPGDRVGTVLALRHAIELLANTSAPCVIIAAVDSLIVPELKEYYRSQRRLLTPNNSNGFCLGEAGSAVLVVRPDVEKRELIDVLGMGTALESACVESDKPLRAEGLAAAIREAYAEAALTHDDVDYRISDANGEHYKFKEIALAMMRFDRKPKPRLFDLWHPIEYIGDVGTAVGPIVLGWALHASRHGYAIGPRVLCTFGNDDGARAAAVLSYRGVTDVPMRSN